MYAGDIVYPMFWYFLLRLMWWNSSRSFCAFLIFGFCTLIEMSQLIDTPFLNHLRHHFLGAILLGSGFDWPDILYYALGLRLAVVLEHLMSQLLSSGDV